MESVDIVTAEVREIARRHALDPIHEADAVRRLVDDVLADYADRVTSGAAPPLADDTDPARSVFAQLTGFGVLQTFLDDPTVEEIWINEPGKVFVARNGVAELTTTLLTDGELRDLVERMLAHSGRRVDLSSPFVDASLPDGSRLHVVIPDITRRHWAVNIRKFVVRARDLNDLKNMGTLTSQAAAFLHASVAAGLNILVSGGTQAGKTTLLNCLAAAIPPRERVITCEEVFELDLPLRDVVGLQCRQPGLAGTGAVSLRRLVTEALRMRPDRLVVGEVRQAESLDLLIALNSGVPGMCTLHANSAREAITKMCTLPLLAGENIGTAFVVPTVAASVDLVVQIGLDGDGRRRVREIVAVPGRTEAGAIEVTDVFRRQGEALVRAGGHPPHADRFARMGYDLAALLAA